MARRHITYPDAVDEKLQDIIRRHDLKPLTVYSKAMQLVLEDLQRRYGEAANDPSIAGPEGERINVSPQAADALASAGIPPAPPPPTYIMRGDARWFEINGVARELGIDATGLTQNLDPDDVLEYAGRTWIDKVGLDAALGMSAPPKVETFNSWLSTL